MDVKVVWRTFKNPDPASGASCLAISNVYYVSCWGGMALSNVLGNFQPRPFPKTWVHFVQRIVLVAGAELKTKVILFGEPFFSYCVS